MRDAQTLRLFSVGIYHQTPLPGETATGITTPGKERLVIYSKLEPGWEAPLLRTRVASYRLSPLDHRVWRSRPEEPKRRWSEVQVGRKEQDQKGPR